MDIFWGDTMYVIPWYHVLVAGCLVLGVLLGVGILFTGLLGKARRR